MPVELLNLLTQGALGAIFFYLYWDTKKRAQEQDDKHDRDIAALYNMRINDLKLFARLPTDLEGNYTMPPKTA